MTVVFFAATAHHQYTACDPEQARAAERDAVVPPPSRARVQSKGGCVRRLGLQFTQQSCRNQLLARLSADDFALLGRHLEPVDLAPHQVVFEPQTAIRHAYFLESGIASVIANVSRTSRIDVGIEVGIYGREGMGGTALLMGADRTPHRHLIQVAGRGHRIASKALLDATVASRSLHMSLLRFAHVFGTQTSATAVANATSVIGARLSRWLLMCQDRIDGSEVPITHAFVATMLGVRRPGITTAIHELEGEHLIKGQRGQITILDRAGLIRRAGASYGVPEAEYRRLIGPLS